MDSVVEETNSHRQYHCRYCGEADESNFYKGRKTTCKKCRYKSRVDSESLKSIISNSETNDSKCFRDAFNSFVLNDITLFQGENLYQIIQENRNEISHLKMLSLNLDSQVNELKDSLRHILSEMSNYVNENRRLRNEISEIKKS